MGIIIRQSIKGTIWIYLGAVIGFITTAYLYPKFLTPEVVGLFGLLVSYSSLAGRMLLLGLPGVTSRLFTYFRDKNNGNNGFLFIALLFHVLGIAAFLILFYVFKPYLIESNLDSSPLFARYLYLLVPMTLAMMVFTFLDSFNKVLYNAVLGTFLQEFLQRFFIIIVTLLFAFKVISLEQLIISYAIAVSLKALMIFLYLIRREEFDLRIPDKKVLTPVMRREIVSVALFSLVGGLGAMVVFKLDKIIINQMLDLSNTGVYTIAFYFGSLIAMPSRPLLKISGTLIADAWKKNDIKTIKDIYYKSCLNQLIIGGFLFLGVWANIDNILIILGDDYTGAKWVIFFIGLGYLIDMATGANGQIITFSKYYRINLVFIFILIVLVVSTMYLLIPVWGIVGAAIAIAASLLLNNLMRYVFLIWKYKMQPFNLKYLVIISFYSGLYILLSYIPNLPFFIDIITRGGLMTLLSILFYLFFPLSDDIKNLYSRILRK